MTAPELFALAMLPKLNLALKMKNKAGNTMVFTQLVLAVIPQPGANYVQISDEFNKRLAEIQKSNKSDITFNVLIDNTRLVRQSIEEVEETLIISFGLVVIVILFFFRNFLVAVRPLIDIPISLVATFFVMYLFRVFDQYSDTSRNCTGNRTCGG